MKLTLYISWGKESFLDSNSIHIFGTALSFFTAPISYSKETLTRIPSHKAHLILPAYNLLSQNRRPLRHPNRPSDPNTTKSQAASVICHTILLSRAIMTDLEQLIDMGFEKERAELAVKQSGGCRYRPQWQWLFGGVF